MSARLAPIRSCMMAVCLRSTHVMSGAKAPIITRTMKSVLTMISSTPKRQPPRPRRSAPPRSEGCALRAYRVDVEPGERGQRPAERPALGAHVEAPVEAREPERRPELREDLAIAVGLERRLDGGRRALHAAGVVRERAVALRRTAGREDDMRGALERGVVGVEQHERVEPPERTGIGEEPGGHEVVAEHDEGAHAAAADALDEGPRIAEAERAGARRVGGLLGLDEQARRRRPGTRTKPCAPRAARSWRSTKRSSLQAWAEATPATAAPPWASSTARSRAAASAIASERRAGARPRGPRSETSISRSGAPMRLYESRPSSQIQVSFTASLRRGT